MSLRRLGAINAQHDRAAQEQGRTLARRSPAAFSPPGLAGLQRLAGNAAVVRALADRQQDGGPPVQRRSRGSADGGMTAHEVLRSAGRPIAAPVCEEMEARLGADFSDVEIHTGPSAAQAAAELGARAFTGGNHIVLGPGADDPHTLAHELTHVIQQRRGPVAGEDTGLGLRVSDPGDRFEREAEANAVRVMRAPLPGIRATGPTGHRRSGAAASVQRTVTVAGQPVRKPGLFDYGPDTAEATWQQITALPSFQSRSPEDQKLIKEQFWKWVDTLGPGRPGAKSHPVFGRKMHEREYATVADLELGLYGWVAAKPGRRAEKQYAQQVRGSAEVSARLNVILIGIYGFIKRLPTAKRDAIVAQLGTNDHRWGRSVRPLGTYQNELRNTARIRGNRQIDTQIRNGFLDVLRNPANYSFRDKVVTLHDLMEYFGHNRPWLLRSEGRDLLEHVESERLLATIGYSGGERLTDPSRGRVAQGTRDEHDPVTRFARDRNLPIWSGTSFTVARTLKLAEWGDMTERDFTALAHSLFAFWRVDYDHSHRLAPHTLHETMDIALNFGARYDPDDPSREFQYDDFDARQRELKADIDARLEKAARTIGTARRSMPEAGPDAAQAEAVAALNEAEQLIREFQDTYPSLKGGERTAAINRVLRVFTLLADHSLA